MVQCIVCFIVIVFISLANNNVVVSYTTTTTTTTTTSTFSTTNAINNNNKNKQSNRVETKLSECRDSTSRPFDSCTNDDTNDCTTTKAKATAIKTTIPLHPMNGSNSNSHLLTTESFHGIVNRRAMMMNALGIATVTAAITATITTIDTHPVLAATSSTGLLYDTNEKFNDLPPEAIRSYLQYRYQLQMGADYYIFDLQSKLQDVNEWGEIDTLFTSNPSRLEREFTNLYRIIGLSMPLDEADTIRDAQYKFERAMGGLKSVVNGIRRDLPVEIDTNKQIPLLLQNWNMGRIAINEIFTVLNIVTGLNELQLVPEYGPNQQSNYGRSERKYIDFKKKIKLCQNRGGPILSSAWGTLMVSGYLQDSCGIPDIEAYFYQTKK